VTQHSTIALDATYAAHPQPTGIGIYSQRLISAFGTLAQRSGAHFPRVVLGFRPGPFVRTAWRQKWPNGFHVAPLFDRWFPIQANLFHGLNQRLPEHAYPRTVITLHERYPAPSGDYSTPEFRAHMDHRIESALARADRIIAVSHSVREHLEEHRPARRDKIRVVHHGVDPASRMDALRSARFLRKRLGLDSTQSFFLNVGAIQVRKNLEILAPALHTMPEVHLVVAGNDGHGAAEIRDFFAWEGLRQRVHFVGHLDPYELQMLYSSAVALAFPSLEEAFGMPVLEAMSCGCPVITSNISALPEVAGDAAILVDPNSPRQISEAMHAVLRDAALAADLREKGRRRAADFSWEKCAKETWAVYEELL